MAIPIIGESSATPTELPFPDIDWPAPSSADEATPILDEARVKALLSHDSPLVRAFAVRRLAASKGDLSALIERIDDESPAVSRAAIDSLADAGQTSAIDKIADRFANTEGAIAAEAAVALGRLDPDRLLAALKTRKRLDDYTYAITTMQLARIESEDVQAYLSKSMNRAGALDAPRRVALYTAALLCGAPTLVRRVLGTAISDSRAEEKDGRTSPARVAIAAAAGLPASMAAQGAGASLLSSLQPESEDPIEEPAFAEFESAVRLRKPAEAIRAFGDLVGAEPSERGSEELQSAVRRCGALLSALVDNADTIDGLAPEAAAIFAAAALDAGAVVRSGRKADALDPGAEALSKALEIEPAALLDGTVQSLTEVVAAKSARDVRRAIIVLGGEPTPERTILDMVVEALLRGGHGVATLDGAAEAKTEHLAQSVLRIFPNAPRDAESAALDALERRPLEERPAGLALGLAAQLGTQRLALAIGRRFLDLRQADRFRLANAVLRMGDARLAPLVGARAYEGEPEEVAFVLLSLLAGEPKDGKLGETLARIEARDGEPERDELRLPLRCDKCDETLSYGFARVFVDPKATEKHGDPAFAGDVICKACGANDTLVPTESAIRMMTETMVSFLIDAEQGNETANPKVIPRRTRYNGREMSVAEALRQATQDVEASPESIRPRLRRARMRLLLRRSGAVEDANAALEIDGTSPEALYVRAGAKAQANDLPGAVEDLAAALRLVQADEEPRLYEETVETVERETGLSLLQLEELGASLPADLDLRDVRQMQAAAEAEMEARYRQQIEQRAQRQAIETPQPDAQGDVAAIQKVRRNDPCPCGSGKKYKKCHGAAPA